MQQWFWNTVLKKTTLKEPLKKSLAAYIKKKIAYKVDFYAKIWYSQLREKGGGRVFLH